MSAYSVDDSRIEEVKSYFSFRGNCLGGGKREDIDVDAALRVFLLHLFSLKKIIA